MKVVAFNGSPRKNGNTHEAIITVAAELEKENIEVEIIHVGNKVIRGCMACGGCGRNMNERCVVNDEVNEWIQKMKEADGIIIGSPVHYSAIAGTMKSFLDRAFYVASANGGILRHKVGASVVAVRRSGGVAVFNKELADMTSKKQLMDNIVETMYNSISAGNTVEFDKTTNEIQQYCVNYINSKTGDREKFNTILTNMFTLYSDITSTDTPKGFNDVLNLFYTTTEVSENFMKALKDIENNVYMEDYGKAPQGDISLNLSDSMLLFSKLQSEIKNGAYLLNSFTDKGNAIDLNSEEFALENMYVLPLKNLLSKNDSLGIAWFSFAFAALIDGLTLLFALISKSSRHLLSAKKNSQIAGNSEELMEELLLSSLILHRAENKDKENIQNILEHLANFLTLFKITPFGMEEGFSLYCPLDKLSEYQIFLSVICQFNLAKIISHEDFELLRTVPSMEEFETLIEEQSSLADSLDEVAAMKLGNNNPAYVLLKTKFIVWVNKKLSAASSDKKLSIILTDILKNIEYSNETY